MIKTAFIDWLGIFILIIMGTLALKFIRKELKSMSLFTKNKELTISDCLDYYNGGFYIICEDGKAKGLGREYKEES